MEIWELLKREKSVPKFPALSSLSVPGSNGSAVRAVFNGGTVNHGIFPLVSLCLIMAAVKVKREFSHYGQGSEKGKKYTADVFLYSSYNIKEFERIRLLQ